MSNLSLCARYIIWISAASDGCVGLIITILCRAPYMTVLSGAHASMELLYQLGDGGTTNSFIVEYSPILVKQFGRTNLERKAGK